MPEYECNRTRLTQNKPVVKQRCGYWSDGGKVWEECPCPEVKTDPVTMTDADLLAEALAARSRLDNLIAVLRQRMGSE